MEFTPLQKKFIDAYKRTPLAKQFYLTGGTLLAVHYLHHRHSLDLDFFANKPVVLGKVQPSMNVIAKQAHIALSDYRRVADRYEWEIRDDHEHTKVEFVFYDFKPLKPRLKWQGILIDTLHDVVANKVFAMLERHEPKDIFDIYYLLGKTKWKLAKFLQLMHQKFGLKINEQTFLIDAELTLKRLDAVRGLLITKAPKEQEAIFKEIHDYFDDIAREFLRKQLQQYDAE